MIGRKALKGNVTALGTAARVNTRKVLERIVDPYVFVHADAENVFEFSEVTFPVPLNA
jgi:hypothetical protein